MNTEGLELKFTKLDGRHRGTDTFKYYVTVKEKVHTYRYKESYVPFFKLRWLCAEIWGMSCEREIYLKAQHEKNTEMLNNHWAWHTDLNNNQYRIYLKSDEERAWLLLKW